MYRTCLFCHADLGRNERIEPFPVGRRLAFDPARGRLWVICGHCGRWCLSPLEERWEAIEECDRAYRVTRRRVVTDQIGMATMRDGFSLVRIGNPLRPEFAGWRYGAELARRRWRVLSRSFVFATGWVALTSGPTALAGPAGTFLTAMALGFAGPALFRRDANRIVARVHAPDGNHLDVRRSYLTGIRLVEDDRGRWAVRLRGGDRLVDDAATRVLGIALARFNLAGGSRRQIRRAVDQLESVGGPEGVRRSASAPQGVTLRQLSAAQSLALEMAVHEDSERRAFDGELAALEQAWREAEEIAKIADNLLVPRSVTDFLRVRRTPNGGPGEASGDHA